MPAHEAVQGLDPAVEAGAVVRPREDADAPVAHEATAARCSAKALRNAAFGSCGAIIAFATRRLCSSVGGDPRFDEQDLLQAVFLKVDVIPVDGEGE